jgi:hypothetical protein
MGRHREIDAVQSSSRQAIHAAQSKNPENLAISGVFNFFANAVRLISWRCVFIANQNSLS